MPKKWRTKICNCPDIKPHEYDFKTHIWRSKTFLSMGLPLVFHMPLGIGGVIEGALNEVKKRGYVFDESRHMLIQKDGLFWGAIMVEVDNPNIEDKELVKIENAELISKSHIGQFNTIINSFKDLETYVKRRGKKIEAVYFWYTTCPRCTPNWNKYKTVIFAQVI